MFLSYQNYAQGTDIVIRRAYLLTTYLAYYVSNTSGRNGIFHIRYMYIHNIAASFVKVASCHQKGKGNNKVLMDPFVFF